MVVFTVGSKAEEMQGKKCSEKRKEICVYRFSARLIKSYQVQYRTLDVERAAIVSPLKIGVARKVNHYQLGCSHIIILPLIQILANPMRLGETRMEYEGPLQNQRGNGETMAVE